jgi:hypothetical protein
LRSRFFSAALKAGLLGGFAASLLLVARQSFEDNRFLQVALIPPAMIIVWLVTGIGAAMLCEGDIKSSQDSASVGLVAGIIAGAFGGITAMIIAAFGVSFQDSGQGVLAQVSDTNLQVLAELGFNQELIILAGSILTALFACGLGGIVVAGLFARLGGWLYPKFNR